MSATEVEHSQADNSSPLLSMMSPPSCELEQRRQLLAVGKVILEQAVDLVEYKLASDDQLLINAKHLPGSTIGKHLRHARDHFEALLDSTNLHPKPLALDYDARKRDIPMESNLKAASEALRGTIDKMEEIIPKTAIHSPITLHAITPYEQSVTTTFGREMWFCELHAVHHWAVVRVICGELGITLEDSFGFAPSTMVHQGSMSGSGLEKAKI